VASLVKGVVIPMSVGFLSAASTTFAAAEALQDIGQRLAGPEPGD
jgi:hypothetical protein